MSSHWFRILWAKRLPSTTVDGLPSRTSDSHSSRNCSNVTFSVTGHLAGEFGIRAEPDAALTFLACRPTQRAAGVILATVSLRHHAPLGLVTTCRSNVSDSSGSIVS